MQRGETFENCPEDCLPPGECPDGQVLDCDGSNECWPLSWIGDGFPDCEDQQYGADLTCYDNDGGDCGGLLSDYSGPKVELSHTSAPAITDLSENMSRELLAYEVYRGLASGGAYTNVGTTDASVTSFVDEGLTNGTEYFYVVTAVYDEGESGYSNEASATPAEFEPIPPVNLQANAGDAEVQLTWTAPNGGGDVMAVVMAVVTAVAVMVLLHAMTALMTLQRMVQNAVIQHGMSLA